LDRGGVRELVQPGKTGILLKEISAQSLLHVLGQLANSSPDQYGRDSYSAYVFAQKMYLASQLYSRYEEYIQKIHDSSSEGPGN
jgi:glycosyltransferase involved in cell wall biosynthesis